MADQLDPREVETLLAFLQEDLELTGPLTLAMIVAAYGGKLRQYQLHAHAAEARADRAERLSDRLVDALCALGSRA